MKNSAYRAAVILALATALAQALVTVITLIAELGSPLSGPVEILLLNGFFIALWIVSALLFRRTSALDSK
jgi:hypothetical protein